MKKQFVNMLAAVLPTRALRKKFRKKCTPFVTPPVQPAEKMPEVYNKEGGRMSIFFIKDEHFAHRPNSGLSKWIYWDRYDYGIDTHFYTHKNVLTALGKPVKKYAWFTESEAIVPNDFCLFDKHPGLEKDFDIVFTHSARMLDNLPNAKFCIAGSTWYGNYLGGGIMHEEQSALKKKNISMLASGKEFCEMHALRKHTALGLRGSSAVDVYGTFAGGPRIPFIADALADYRYSIAIENDITPYYFTEKITNCFASMTVPIYVGASAIDKFFNPDGIIQVKKEDIGNITKIIQQCSPTDYKSRLSAIKDNYERVKRYLVIEDYLFENYFQEESC